MRVCPLWCVQGRVGRQRCLLALAVCLLGCPHLHTPPWPTTAPPAVAHFPTAVKEFAWRNGYFWGLSQEAAAAGRSDPCPTHTTWLKEVGAI